MIDRGARHRYDDAAGDSQPSRSRFLSRTVRIGGAGALCAALGACSAHEGAPTASMTPAPSAALAAAEGGTVQPTSLQTTVPMPTPAPSLAAVPVTAKSPVPMTAAAQKPVADRKFGRSGSGLASWYGARFHGRPTANGERFSMGSFTAAHRSFPLPSYVRVTNVQNGRSMVVRVNDRGPFHGGRVIDVSSRAADVLGFKGTGVGSVKLDLVGPAPENGSDDRRLLASYQEFGRPAVAPGTQMAMAPVSDQDLAAETSSYGAGAFAVASAAVTKSVAAVKSSAAAVASTAKAAVRSVMPAGTAAAPSQAAPVQAVASAAPAGAPVQSPSPIAYAPPQPLVASAPAAITSPSASHKRIVAPSEPVLASAAPVAPAAAPASPAAPKIDVSSRISAGFAGLDGF